MDGLRRCAGIFARALRVCRLGPWALLVLLLSCAPVSNVAPGDTLIEGRVTRDGSGVEGASVYLTPAQAHAAPDSKPEAQVLSGSDGSFRVTAPKGTYIVTARKGGQFAFFGRNPVRTGPPISGLHLPLADAHPVSRSRVRQGDEFIQGRVLHAGRPVQGARIFVYVDPSRGLRGPGYAVSDPTGPDGAYRIPLPPGTYYVAARFRAGGWRAGALEPGDQFGVLPEFPLVLRRDQAIRADIETTELPGHEQMARFRGGFSRISGRIVDPSGEPVAGLRACLYDKREMLDRPRLVSPPTRQDGRFVIENTPAGSFYLGAREVLGGPPAPGERVGFYRGPQGTKLDVNPGQRLAGLTVTVQVVP